MLITEKLPIKEPQLKTLRVTENFRSKWVPSILIHLIWGLIITIIAAKILIKTEGRN